MVDKTIAWHGWLLCGWQRVVGSHLTRTLAWLWGGKNRIGMNLNCFHSKASDYSKIQKRLTKELQVNSLEVLSSVGIMV